MDTVKPSQRWPWLVAGLALTALGVFGTLRAGREGWGGFIYNPGYVVDWVEPNSGAEAAGLQARDSVLSVDGTPATELPMQSRWANTPAGASHRLVVMRDGQEIAVDVVYRPRGSNPFAQGALAVFLMFLWGGIWVRLTVPTAAARTLAYIGFAAGVVIAATPNVGGFWNGVLSHLQMATLVLLTLFILRFFLVFPKPKRVSESRVATLAAYGLLAALVVFLVVEMLVHPRLYLVTGNVGSLLSLAFVTLALVALIHSLATMPRGQTWDSGLGWALVGFAAATAGIVVPVLGMAMRLPGTAGLELLLALLPVTLVLAVRKQARWEGAAG